MLEGLRVAGSENLHFKILSENLSKTSFRLLLSLFVPKKAGLS
jgi:hypothetical protein